MDESNDDQPRGSREDSTRPLPLEAIEPDRQVTPSKIRIWTELNFWIRIRIWIESSQIHNPGINYTYGPIEEQYWEKCSSRTILMPVSQTENMVLI
jgi:hypothetical protein